jgi:hypothetical protein
MAPAAVIIPANGAAAGTVEAMERQTRPPGRIIALDSTAELGDAIQQALESDRSWVWLLDGGVLPEPEALEHLLAAAEISPAAVLLVSKFVSPAGALDSASLPVPEVHRGDRVLSALQAHAVPLRVARRGSMLVGGEAAKALDAQTIDRVLEWTAQLLKRDQGLLVPTSVVVRPGATQRPARPKVAATVRTLAALEPRERLWFAAYFGEQALASRSERGGV